MVRLSGARPVPREKMEGQVDKVRVDTLVEIHPYPGPGKKGVRNRREERRERNEKRER